MTQPSQSPSRLSAGGIALRLIALLAIVVAATWASHQIRDALDLQLMPENEQQMHRAIVVGSIAYIGLLAMPFVPGAEIGIAMLTAFGADIAPLIYCATVIAMLLAYTVGRFLPITILIRLLAFFRMRRAADLVSRVAPMPQDARVALLMEGAPPRLIALALRHRYIALALCLNIPGNAIVGGGGIMMLAGLSGIFAPLPTALSIMIAVSPIPIVVMLTGM